jgi:hypothetical protein
LTVVDITTSTTNNPPTFTMTNTSAAKQKALEAYSGAIIFAEELTANEGQSHAIEGLDPEKSVRDLRHCIARAVNNLPSWSTMQVIFAGEVMDDSTSPFPTPLSFNLSPSHANLQ